MLDYENFNDMEQLTEYYRTKYPDRTLTNIRKKIVGDIPNEGYFQDKIIKYLQDKYGKLVVWKEAAGMYSQGGVPDITLVHNGRYFGFEVKRPFVGKVSELQSKRIEAIKAAGGVAEVVSYVSEVKKIIQAHDKLDALKRR